MHKFARQPYNTNLAQPADLHFTSWRTAELGGKLYDIRKLNQLADDLPTTQTPLAKLEKMKEGKYWHDKNGQWIGPTEILDLYYSNNGQWSLMKLSQPPYASHTANIQQANYDRYPIILVGSIEEAWVIDGMHRLTKAWIDQADVINTKRFAQLPDAAIVN